MYSITKYQKQCVAEISKKILNGDHRVNVIAPYEARINEILFLTVKTIRSKKNSKDIVIVTDDHDVTVQKDYKKKKYQVKVMSIEDAIRSAPRADIYLMYLVGKKERIKLQGKLLLNPDTIFICFEELAVYRKTRKARRKRLRDFISFKADKPIIDSSRTIWTVSDIVYADWETKKKIKKLIVDNINNYEKNQQETQKVIEDKCLQYNKANGSAVIVNTNNEEIEQLRAVAKQYEQQISDLKLMLMYCGIPGDEIEDMLCEIADIRDSMKDMLKDVETSDEAFVTFQTLVSDKIEELTSRIITIETKESFERILRKSLSDDIWDNKLSEDSKKSLVTAKISYMTLKGMDVEGDIDFSAVCILVSKALEAEITKRLYGKYIAFLLEKYPLPESVGYWPLALVKDNKNTIVDEREFNLGTVKHLLYNHKDAKGSRQYSTKIFINFARECLYKEGFTEDEIRDRVNNLVSCVEKVRKEYRNPSAHDDWVSKITAESCMNYMIDVEKKLKEILIDMRE